VACKKIKIRAVCGKTLPIIVQGEDGPIGQGNAANTLAITVLSVFTFINVVTEMYNIVDRILQQVSLHSPKNIFLRKSSPFALDSRRH
jgi:hypothetical protein